MKPAVHDRIAQLKRSLKPRALSWLGRLPVTGRYSGLGQILMFHRVIPPDQMSRYDMAAFEITPQALEMLLNFFLERGYRVISLDQVSDVLAGGAASDKFIVLTFDDGYKDTLTNAYPILREYGAPFTIYVAGNYAERRAIKWDYLAEDIIDSHDRVAIDTQRGRVELDCSTSEMKAQSCGALQELLYEMSDAESSARMQAFFSFYRQDVYEKTDELMLDWRQIAELARDPLVTIGAHSVNHYVLSRLPDAVAKDEILGSKTMLESRLGLEVRHFAYPYGRSHEAGEREFETVRHCGFTTGSTGVKGNIFRECASRLTSLPRFCLGSNCTRDHLAAIANGSLSFLANRFRRSASAPIPSQPQQG